MPKLGMELSIHGINNYMVGNGPIGQELLIHGSAQHGQHHSEHYLQHFLLYLQRGAAFRPRPLCTHTHTHIYIYIYIYLFLFVCFVFR